MIPIICVTVWANMPSKKISFKKIVIPLAAALLVLVAAVAVVLFATAPISQHKAVAFVDDYPIYAGEMMLAVEQIKSDTVMYFIDTYGAVQNKTFWEQEYGGENPREKLITDALELAARYKKEQIMMLDYGVITEAEMVFEAFCKEFYTENRERLAADKKGETIYGPVQYTKQGYYDYLHNNRITDLKWEVNKKITGDTSLTYESENFEQQYDAHYKDKKIIREDDALSKLDIK